MREVHNIIRSRPALEQFVDWLPDLNGSERFFVCLQARKKYMPTLKASDKTQLKRFTATKQTLISKIEQLECPVGCYRTKDDDIITDDAIALYITLNPRDMRKATFMGAKSLIDMIEKQDEGGLPDFNPHSEILSCIHRAKSRTAFVHFDVDKPENDGLFAKEVKEKAVNIVGKEAVTVIETRGGCHLMIAPSKVICEHKNWHPMIVKQIKCDQTGDLMVPVVGCCQGGFVPKFC